MGGEEGKISDSREKKARITFLWRLAEKIAENLRSDPRVESIWVSGSLAREEADGFSDLDMAALIQKSKFSEFMQESRKEKWLSLGAEGWMDGWGDKFVIKGIPFTLDYLTLDRIMNCGWDELEYIEWVLAGILYSKVICDPGGTLKRLKKEFSVYPEQLRKRRILQLDDDIAMYTYLAEIEIKRKDYVNAAYYLRNAASQMAHLLFPINGQYFVSKSNLLGRISKLDKVPNGFCEQFMSILFDLKPVEASMTMALTSMTSTLEDLRKNFDYMKFRDELPVWASKKP